MLNDPIRFGTYSSFNALWAGAVRIHEELGRWLAERERESGRSATFATAKHIAAVASALERAEGVALTEALNVATDVVKSNLCLSSGSAKKNRSEALAILEMRPKPLVLSQDPPSHRSRLHLAFAEIVTIPIAAARRRRAERLGGACGGRPSNRTARTLALVRLLVQRASIDPQAAEELRLIRSELSGFA